MTTTRRLTESDLKRELAGLKERYPALAEDHLFVLWFLSAFVTEEEARAADSLTGGPNDKGLDAVYLDDRAKQVVLVQGKYRRKVGRKSEAYADVMTFANLPACLFGDAQAFKNFVDGMDPLTSKHLQEARVRLLRRGYQLQLHYVTVGKVSKVLAEEARRVAKQNGRPVSLTLLGGREVLLMLADYLDGVAPPVPSLDLELESGEGLKLTGAFERYDGKTGIDSWMFSIRAATVGRMYDRAGPRLFARNVRGFLGSTEINRGMEKTLDREPEYFWYYNNGITIVCDQAELTKSGGIDIMRLTNPQVINGQQTTRTLHRHGGRGSKASVLVRVIRIPREPGVQGGRFETLVSRIVAATNWQNAIRPSDLMANDRRQIDLEREFRKLGYHYVRKRQTKGEARQLAGMRYRFLIRKEELAQAVAACDLDPMIVREGKDRLFEEQHYSQVFSSSDPLYYISRYWLMRQVSYSARGYPERAYAKWMVLHFLWAHLGRLVRGRNDADHFRRVNERNLYPLTHLVAATDSTFNAALQFYRTKRGKGAKAIDVSSFFKRRGLDVQFDRFWRGQINRSRGGFRRHWARFIQAMKDEDVS